MEECFLKHFCDESVKKYNLPSLQVVVSHKGNEAFRYQYGCNEKSMYIGYSSTKPFIGAAISKLIDEGKTSLDTPAFEYLPEFNNMQVFVKNSEGIIIGAKKLEENKPVLIRHLASMTGGIADFVSTPYISSSIESGKKSTQDIVKAILRQPLSFEPGTDYKYGLSLDVLAVIIEIISGKKLSEYLSENFFIPLGMNETTFHPSEEQKSRLLQQYMWYNEGGYYYAIPNENSFAFTEEYESGGAGAYFTCNDYLKFASALANGGGGILSPFAVEIMRTPLLNEYTRERYQTLLGFPCYTYGACVRIMDEPERFCYVTPKGEFGWQGKGGTYCSISPELDTAIFMGIQICDYHPVNIVMHTQLREAVYQAVINGDI